MIVIADATPINYLVLIGKQELLPILFGQIVIPKSVLNELREAATPNVVRQWIENPPIWLEIRQVSMSLDASLSHLDDGEREAIQLAEELGAGLLFSRRKSGSARSS